MKSITNELLFHSYIDHPVIQNNKHVLNNLLNQECFPSHSIYYDNFYVIDNSNNKIQYILIKPAIYNTRTTITINDKYYNVLSMMRVDYNNNDDATIWNVCTGKLYRGKKYFTKMFTMFLQKTDRLNELYLYVKKDAPKNISLYTHLGFRIIGEKDDKFYMKFT